MDRRGYLREMLGVEPATTADSLAFHLASEFTASVLEEVDRRGITLKELADEMGIKPATLSGMLRDDANLTLKTMARMALALDCEIDPPALVPKESIVASEMLPLGGDVFPEEFFGFDDVFSYGLLSKVSSRGKSSVAPSDCEVRIAA